MPTSNQPCWHEPPVSTIYLASGQTVQAHVNGLDFDRTSGFVFVGDREMAVKRIDNTDEWREVTEQQSEGLAISPASHHGSFHDLPSTSVLS